MLNYNVEANKRGIRVWKIAGGVLAALALAVILALVLGLLVQYLWNVTLAVIFKVPAITYWQAVGMFLLAKLFFSLGHGHDVSHAHDHKKLELKWRLRDKESKTDEAQHDDETFQKYWATEGRRAYEEYIQKQKDTEA